MTDTQLFDDATLAEARDFFGKDLYSSQQTGIVLEAVGEHYAKCSLELDSRHTNAYGGVMGGVIFTMADFTFAASSNFRQPHTVSVTSQINFIGMAKGKKLFSESKLIKDGRSVCVYEIDITDELGTKVAFVTFTGMKLKE
ncbi:MAG: PaaI family thioesterase [Treponemataceae bacterium]|nr:PaaI family thioesterase [Treponemataceae bacterium]